MKAKLYVLKPGFDQNRESLFGKAYTRGNQIYIETRTTGACDQFLQVGPREGLTPGEMDVQRPQARSFPEHSNPIRSKKFRRYLLHLDRIRAVNTMQWATMGNLGNEC
ncbi:MAG: hypothetical protein NVS9B5_37590 [Terriglobales bacterium]